MENKIKLNPPRGGQNSRKKAKPRPPPLTTLPTLYLLSIPSFLILLTLLEPLKAVLKMDPSSKYIPSSSIILNKGDTYQFDLSSQSLFSTLINPDFRSLNSSLQVVQPIYQTMQNSAYFKYENISYSGLITSHTPYYILDRTKLLVVQRNLDSRLYNPPPMFNGSINCFKAFQLKLPKKPKNSTKKFPLAKYIMFCHNIFHVSAVIITYYGPNTPVVYKNIPEIDYPLIPPPAVLFYSPTVLQLRDVGQNQFIIYSTASNNTPNQIKPVYYVTLSVKDDEVLNILKLDASNLNDFYDMSNLKLFSYYKNSCVFVCNYKNSQELYLVGYGNCLNASTTQMALVLNEPINLLVEKAILTMFHRSLLFNELLVFYEDTKILMFCEYWVRKVSILQNCKNIKFLRDNKIKVKQASRLYHTDAGFFLQDCDSNMVYFLEKDENYFSEIPLKYPNSLVYFNTNYVKLSPNIPQLKKYEISSSGYGIIHTNKIVNKTQNMKLFFQDFANDSEKIGIRIYLMNNIYEFPRSQSDLPPIQVYKDVKVDYEVPSGVIQGNMLQVSITPEKMSNNKGRKNKMEYFFNVIPHFSTVKQLDQFVIGLDERDWSLHIYDCSQHDTPQLGICIFRRVIYIMKRVYLDRVQKGKDNFIAVIKSLDVEGKVQIYCFNSVFSYDFKIFEGVKKTMISNYNPKVYVALYFEEEGNIQIYTESLSKLVQTYKIENSEIYDYLVGGLEVELKGQKSISSTSKEEEDNNIKVNAFSIESRASNLLILVTYKNTSIILSINFDIIIITGGIELSIKPIQVIETPVDPIERVYLCPSNQGVTVIGRNQAITYSYSIHDQNRWVYRLGDLSISNIRDNYCWQIQKKLLMLAETEQGILLFVQLSLDTMGDGFSRVSYAEPINPEFADSDLSIGYNGLNSVICFVGDQPWDAIFIFYTPTNLVMELETHHKIENITIVQKNAENQIIIASTQLNATKFISDFEFTSKKIPFTKFGTSTSKKWIPLQDIIEIQGPITKISKKSQKKNLEIFSKDYHSQSTNSKDDYFDLKDIVQLDLVQTISDSKTSQENSLESSNGLLITKAEDKNKNIRFFFYDTLLKQEMGSIILRNNLELKTFMDFDAEYIRETGLLIIIIGLVTNSDYYLRCYSVMLDKNSKNPKYTKFENQISSKFDTMKFIKYQTNQYLIGVQNSSQEKLTLLNFKYLDSSKYISVIQSFDSGKHPYYYYYFYQY